MKTIIIIGLNKSGSSIEAITAAINLGYFVVVFTNRIQKLEYKEDWEGRLKLMAVTDMSHEDIRFNIILLQQRGHEIIAITSFYDQGVYIASTLSDEFCRYCLSTNSIHIMINKRETREFFKNESFTPAFWFIDPNNARLPKNLFKKIVYPPVIVKRAISSGSKDVYLSTNLKEIRKHLAILRGGEEEKSVVIEEYIEGEQYLVEVLVFEKQALIAAIVKQEITKGKRFIVTGYGVLAEVDSNMVKEIEELTNLIVVALKIKFGVFHMEIRLSKTGWKLIELNPRIAGGAMNKMIQAAFGYNLVEETIKMLTGKKPLLIKKKNNYVFTQYLIAEEKGILKKVIGKEEALETPGVVEVYVKPRIGKIVTPPLRMGHRCGYIMAIANNPEAASYIAKEATRKIIFQI